jgi:hypothetical protein
MNRLVLALAIACVISSVDGQKVRVDFKHGGNFNHYSTYRWAGPPDAQFLNQLMIERVTGFVEEALATKHLRHVQTGGDLAVHYRLTVEDQPRFITYNDGIGPYWDWGGTISTTITEPFLVSTLTVDVVDAGRDQLIFEGVSTQSISSKPERNTRRFARAVNKIFEKYPPQ